jgi:hypothetical protein
VLYVDDSDSGFGTLAELSFESGAMFLNGNLVRMNFPRNRNARTHWLDVSGRPENHRRYSTSGYELGSQEDATSNYDPILFYSLNSHRVCPHKLMTNSYPSDAFRGRQNTGDDPILLLVPDFPWLKDCARVRLMKLRDSSSSGVTKPEFSPTGLYTTSLRHRLVHVTQSPMSFTVICLEENQCRCHGCVIILGQVRKLTIRSPSVLTIYRMDISGVWKETNANLSKQ